MAPVCNASLAHSCTTAAAAGGIGTQIGQASREVLDIILLAFCFFLGCALFRSLRVRMQLRVRATVKDDVLASEVSVDADAKFSDSPDLDDLGGGKGGCDISDLDLEDWPDLWALEENDCVTCCPSDNSTLSFASNSDDAEDNQFDERSMAAVEEDASCALSAALSSGDAVIVDAVLKTGARLCDVSWTMRACARLKEVGIPLSQERGIEFVQTFALANRADLAVDLWQERCTETSIGASTEAFEEDLYSATLEACASCGDFEAASRVAQSTEWRAPSYAGPGLQAWLGLVRWFARRGVLGPALQCYEAARSNGAIKGADLPTHKTLLKACISSNDMSRADVLFQDLLAKGVAPDFATFSAMVNGHRSAGNAREAVSYFEHMRRNGIQPDASLFDAVLDSCGWRDAPALIEQVLVDMEASGVKPSTTTLATILKLYGNSCSVDRALAAFEELPRRHGLDLDGRAYTAMISTCLRGGRLDLALETHHRQRLAGFAAPARVSRALVAALRRRGDLDAAVRLLLDVLRGSGAAVADGGSDEENLTPVPSSIADAGLVEELATLIGQRREARRLGLPLLRQLHEAGVQVDPALAGRMLAAAFEEEALGMPFGAEETNEEFAGLVEAVRQIAGSHAPDEDMRRFRGEFCETAKRLDRAASRRSWVENCLR
eukprot:TRINITY_DN17012_c0_g1_i1.p1 TRINITY_DN17012_c0_g1~~TRINITY_DN17012_c0_g1_i1.p1  ORF type:complete len:665 (-),score=157.92 TRINITY_DN17012_c0_g1_i1:277-2271(-)